MRLLLGLLLLMPLAGLAQEACPWPLWQQFKNQYVDAGRVVDLGSEQDITTSEGQSYGLFFALIADDSSAFAELLDWTERHLAGGDLTAQLPAWLWGRGEEGSYTVLDGNAAADSDLWIAYVLAEAGRLWQQHRYSTLAYLLGRRILKEETRHIDGLGPVLLPGPMGFELGPDRYRLNPSYWPPQLFDALQQHFPAQGWSDLGKTSQKLLLQVGRGGWMPDWFELNGGALMGDSRVGPVGSYDAIRHYLWVGMLAENHPARSALLQTVGGMRKALEANPLPPEKVNVNTGATMGNGPFGFSAAVLPMSSDRVGLARQLAQRSRDGLAKSAQQPAYYNAVLSLFGLGWQQGRFRFTEDGHLQRNLEAGCD